MTASADDLGVRRTQSRQRGNEIWRALPWTEKFWVALRAQSLSTRRGSPAWAVAGQMGSGSEGC